MTAITFTLSYEGSRTEDHVIDLYDAAQALVGFQRSIALTTHLVLNGQVIVQAPSLKNAQVLALPSEEGSWKITAAVMIGIYTAGTAPIDTPAGHLIGSAYDYVISETLGFHVDYDKSLGQQYEELKQQESDLQSLEQSQLDSVIEKCEVAIRDMHRPIVYSGTADKAQITSTVGRHESPTGAPLNAATFEHIRYTVDEERPVRLTGRVSSFNINTYKGRIFLEDEQRPVPFELAPYARDTDSVVALTDSLTGNARSRFQGAGDVRIRAIRRTSKSGRLKGLLIERVL